MSDTAQGYWMYETSGVLRPAVRAYLNNETMTPLQIAAMRAYLRLWIGAPHLRGAEVETLRRDVDTLTTQSAMRRWIHTAIDAGVDPL